MGTVKELTALEVNIRNGNGKRINNTEVNAKPISHCNKELEEVDFLIYLIISFSVLIILLHEVWITMLLKCISWCKKCGVSGHKVLNRLDQLNTEWGHWEGEGNNQVIKPPEPSHFGVGYTVAFLPIAFYTIYQLVVANNPICTAGLQVLSTNRRMEP